MRSHYPLLRILILSFRSKSKIWEDLKRFEKSCYLFFCILSKRSKLRIGHKKHTAFFKKRKDKKDNKKICLLKYLILKEVSLVGILSEAIIPCFAYKRKDNNSYPFEEKIPVSYAKEKKKASHTSCEAFLVVLWYSKRRRLRKEKIITLFLSFTS